MSVSKFSPNTVIAVSTLDLQATSENAVSLKKIKLETAHGQSQVFSIPVFCTEFYMHTHTYPMKHLQPYTDISLKHCMYTSALTTVTTLLRNRISVNTKFLIFIYICAAFTNTWGEKNPSKQTNIIPTLK